MIGFLLRRIAWMLPALFGITLVTFLLIEAAELELHGVHAAASMQEDADVRAQRARELQEQWGMVDPETGERYPIWHRYGQWVGRVVRLDFVGPGRNREVFYERIRSAVPVTLFLNAYALSLGLLLAVPLGLLLAWCAGSWLDRAGTGVLLLLYSAQVVLVVLAILLFSGPLRGWLPIGGLGQVTAGATAVERLSSLAWHGLLPALLLAAPWVAHSATLLRDAVRNALGSEFVSALRLSGAPAGAVRRAALRNGLSPLATTVGVWVGGLLSGSVLVEHAFQLPGLGRLALQAAVARDFQMVLALTVMYSVVMLVALLLSDVLQRWIDPRVELA